MNKIWTWLDENFLRNVTFNFNCLTQLSTWKENWHERQKLSKYYHHANVGVHFLWPPTAFHWSFHHASQKVTTYAYCTGSLHRSTLGRYVRVSRRVCATFKGSSLARMAAFKSSMFLSCWAISPHTWKTDERSHTKLKHTASGDNSCKQHDKCSM